MIFELSRNSVPTARDLFIHMHRVNKQVKKAMDVKNIVFPDRLEIEKLFLTISFSKMTNIENIDVKKIS